MDACLVASRANARRVTARVLSFHVVNRDLKFNGFG